GARHHSDGHQQLGLGGGRHHLRRHADLGQRQRQPGGHRGGDVSGACGRNDSHHVLGGASLGVGAAADLRGNQRGGTGLPVASGGTVFTAGQNLLIDTGTAAEVVQVVAGSTGTNVAISALVKGHGSAVHFGNLTTTPFLSSVQAVPAVSPYPASQPLTF